jgi:hypothetical protein
MLGHLETGDLVVLPFWDGNVAVIHAQNLALLLRDTSLSETIITPSSLVAAESDTGGFGAIVD